MKRAVLFLLPLLVIALVGAVLGFDRIAETAIEKAGSRALGVETTLGSADVGLSGDLGLRDLAIRNPEGYRREDFLTLREGDVVWPLAALVADQVEVELVRLDGLTLDLESPAGGRSNYDIVLDRLEAVTTSGSGEQPSARAGRVFAIDRVVIRELEVRVLVEVGEGTVVESSASVPEITFADIGSAGLSIDEATALLVRLVLIAAVRQGEGELPETLRTELGQRLDRL